MAVTAAAVASGSRSSGSRSGGIGSILGNPSQGIIAALGRKVTSETPEPVSNDPEYLSSANSAYDDAYKAMMDNQGPGGRANAQSSGLRSAFESAKAAREAARFRFKAEEAGMSPEEYNNNQISNFGGILGQDNVSRFGNIRNNRNAAFNSVVGDAQQSYTDNPSNPTEDIEATSEVTSNLRNPLGQELEPMTNAVGFKNSAISNAGKMFGNTYGSLFAGAAKKYEGPAHCNVDTMHTMYWNDMRKRNKTKK